MALRQHVGVHASAGGVLPYRRAAYGGDHRAGGAAAADAAPSTVTVTLVNAGLAKINVIKVIKEITGLGLADSKAIADNGGAVKENISVDEANDIKAKLEEAGAEVEVK